MVRQGFDRFSGARGGVRRTGAGRKQSGTIPVHFHMARKTPHRPTRHRTLRLPEDDDDDSMTRWVHDSRYAGNHPGSGTSAICPSDTATIWKTRTETNNKLYANLGISVIAGDIRHALNPRCVPGILAATDGRLDRTAIIFPIDPIGIIRRPFGS